jgi:hypothetical protein
VALAGFFIGNLIKFVNLSWQSLRRVSVEACMASGGDRRRHSGAACRTTISNRSRPNCEITERLDRMAIKGESVAAYGWRVCPITLNGVEDLTILTLMQIVRFLRQQGLTDGQILSPNLSTVFKEWTLYRRPQNSPPRFLY